MAKGTIKDNKGEGMPPIVSQEENAHSEEMVVGKESLSVEQKENEVLDTEAMTVIIEGSLVENEPTVISRNVYEILISQGKKVEICG